MVWEGIPPILSYDCCCIDNLEGGGVRTSRIKFTYLIYLKQLISFCKVVWQRYLGAVGKFLSYFVANISQTLQKL